MLKIAINTRLLRKSTLDGIGWFSYNTISRIVKNNPDIEFHFFFDSVIDKKFLFADNIIAHNIFPPAKHALLNVAWSEWGVKRKLKKINPDLYFSLEGMLCMGWGGKQHTVIHDINFAHHPEFLSRSNRRYYNKYFPKFAKKACRIATVSKYSKKDIADTYGINPNKIDVVYCGINSFLSPISDDEKNETRNKYTEGSEYFLFIGTLSPRKNVLGLLKAFETYKESDQSGIKLVIAGGTMYRTSEVFEFKSKMKFSGDVVFTGSLSDSELNKIYNSAMALVFVPFFEGFGIPLIEAMQCGIPIIASNVTSIPEVVDDAALLVDPFDPDEIALAMNRISKETSVRQDLVQKGDARKSFFSWDKTADLLWQSIERCF
ncbi:MAG TPA: glycosyltransferase family 1 protein [Chitinophagaceae bacterium]|nr:glycosyltransferase family 1 protein [Chitinophagaceae bacterium]